MRITKRISNGLSNYLFRKDKICAEIPGIRQTYSKEILIDTKNIESSMMTRDENNKALTANAKI